jgi:nucleoside-diphosphate-sugar epimerase
MKALVTGGGGFLGHAIVQQLVARGDEARSFSRGTYAALDRLGAEHHRGDLADAAAVRRAVAGCDLVFHVGAKAGAWGKYEQFYQTNVVGTNNVIDACREAGVRYLVYTSSPSVVFDGSDLEGVDESVPYPSDYDAHYPQTKALAERAVVRANDAQLRTVSLRPHLVWGPGDNHLVPRIVARGRSGQLRRFRGPPKLVDTTYVDDAARAHLLAADRLLGGAADGIAGKVYFHQLGPAHCTVGDGRSDPRRCGPLAPRKDNRPTSGVPRWLAARKTPWSAAHRPRAPHDAVGRARAVDRPLV